MRSRLNLKNKSKISQLGKIIPRLKFLNLSLRSKGIFIKPIKILIANARKIGKGDLNAVVKLPPGDEFDELAEN